jgi:hypothetical protein
MPDKQKVLVLVPDGVSLRNFAYTRFYEIGQSQDLDVIFWNNTSFDLEELGISQIVVKNAKTHFLTNLYKTAKIHIELRLNEQRTNDEVYRTYVFPLSYTSFSNVLKISYIKWLGWRFRSQKGLSAIRKKIGRLERKTSYYSDCMETLTQQRPAMIFCTSQRSSVAIAPITAAKDLGIPTATFIFSWDNLPKATLLLETDFYFVWSDHMKSQLLGYYPNIAASQIIVTGTPQFEMHGDAGLLQSRESFFGEYGLDTDKKYICYSGDDITTSPDDPQYLADVADAIRELNAAGYNLGIIFRRCPVDFSDRYDAVLNRNSDIIAPVSPKWEQVGKAWNNVLPMKDDIRVQFNTIVHSEMVVNLGSSMVFDYAAFGKPCAYINYDVKNRSRENWSTQKIYSFVHFRSMPKNAVAWLNSAETIATSISSVLLNGSQTIGEAKRWFEIINLHPTAEASRRIWEQCKNVIHKS